MMTLKTIPFSDDPCSRCHALYEQGKLRGETVMPLPEGAFAPRGWHREPQCLDCAVAELAIKLGHFGRDMFVAARVAVANERQERFRLPGVMMGVYWRHMNAYVPLAQHQAWCEKHRIKLGSLTLSEYTWEQVDRMFPKCAAKWDAWISKQPDIDSAWDVRLAFGRKSDGPDVIVKLVDIDETMRVAYYFAPPDTRSRSTKERVISNEAAAQAARDGFWMWDT